jgi:hypothetical protein
LRNCVKELANLVNLNKVGEEPDELALGPLLHQNTGVCTTDLTSVAQPSDGGLLGSLLQVGIVKDNQSRFAPGPPVSMDVFFILPAADLMTRFPVAVDPVKAILSISMCAVNASLVSLP